MDKPFLAYRGDEPYVFVCYSHTDTDVVYPELEWLNGQGVHLWYDAGISAGKVWRAEIAEAIDGARIMLYYISAASIASEHCSREVHYALDKGHQVLPVFLEPVALSADLNLGLSRVQALNRHDDTHYQTRVLQALSSPEALPAARTPAASRLPTPPIAPMPQMPPAPPALQVPPATQMPPMPPRRSRLEKFGLPLAVAIATVALAGWWLWRGSDTPGQPAAPSPELPLTSIAVLPFADMSPAGDREHLSDGMAEELILTLAQLDELRVVARTSAFAFKDTPTDIRKIGQALGAGAIVEGSIRTADDQLRITAQLIRTTDGYQLWSGRFDRALNDVFAVQDEIAQAIAAALQLELGLRPPDHATIDFRAFEQKKLGDYYLNKGDEESLRTALQQYQRAIDIAPGYSTAYVGAARAHRMLWSNNYDPSDERRRKITEATQTALQLDPDNAAAIGTQGMNDAFAFNWADAESQLRRALNLDPNNVDLILSFAYLTSMLGDQDAAVGFAHRATELDPLNPTAQYLLGILYNFQDRWSMAAERMERALELGGSSVATRGDLAYVYYRLGREQDALDVVLAGDIPPELESPAHQGFDAGGYLGMIKATLAIVTEGETTCSPFPWNVASGYSQLGDRENMYQCLEEAVDQRQVLMISGYPGMHPYRDEPRFKELLARMNLPYESGASRPINRP